MVCLECHRPTSEWREPQVWGVSIICKQNSSFKLFTKYAEQTFQIIHGVAHGFPVMGAYFAPRIPRADLHRVPALAAKCLQGPGILMGDLNARHTQWDDVSNPQGVILQQWARRHNLCTARPPAPTFSVHAGQRRIYLFFQRSAISPILTVHPQHRCSDHRAVTAELTHASPAALRQVPLAVIKNETCQAIAKARYEETLPPITSALNNASCAASLEINSRRLVTATLHPWTQLCKPRSARFRPGWTQNLDRKARLRSKLLRSQNEEARRRAKLLDCEIKREFRRNVRRLQTDLGDLVAEGNSSTETTLMKRALALNRIVDVSLARVDPESFTKFMCSLQPNSDTTPEVAVICFDVDDCLREKLLRAIRYKLKPSKSPGPDLIRTDIFKLPPERFADATIALWEAVGRTGYVPSILRTGLLASIYKNKGDASLPTNNRPVCLTPGFRRLISTALTTQLTNFYSQSLARQWVFQRGTNTECAICYASNTVRRELPMAAILDLRKAYDSVPRQLLQTMLDEQLPAALSTTFRPLLAPMVLRTKHQLSNIRVRTLVGMPQGDPPSPYIFNLFMDDYIRMINVKVSRGLATLFVDDVLILARSLLDMQRLLLRSKAWSDRVGMVLGDEKIVPAPTPRHSIAWRRTNP